MSRLQNLSSLFCNENHSDIHFIIDNDPDWQDHPIPAHTVILIGASRVLERDFQPGGQCEDADMVTAEGFSASAVIGMLSHIYGVARQTLAFNNELEIYVLAVRCEIVSLVEDTLPKLQSMLQASVDDIRTFTEMLTQIYDGPACGPLPQQVAQICGANFEALIAQEEFRECLGRSDQLRADVAKVVWVDNGGVAVPRRVANPSHN